MKLVCHILCHLTGDSSDWLYYKQPWQKWLGAERLEFTKIWNVAKIYLWVTQHVLCCCLGRPHHSNATHYVSSSNNTGTLSLSLYIRASSLELHCCQTHELLQWIRVCCRDLLNAHILSGTVLKPGFIKVQIGIIQVKTIHHYVPHWILIKTQQGNDPNSRVFVFSNLIVCLLLKEKV